MATSPGGEQTALPPDAALPWRLAAAEFLGALRRRYTYSLRRNPYFLFGLLWGACLPLVVLAAHGWSEGAPIPVEHLVPDPRRFRTDFVFLMFPSVWAVIFGALGTILHDRRLFATRTIRLLDAEVGSRTRELIVTYEQTVLALSQAIEAKDPYTRGHCFRVWEFAEGAAVRLGLVNGELETLKFACFLHDVGKIHIPGRILNKPGALEPEEFALVKLHPVYSERIIAPIEHFRAIATLVRHHHERSDGTGYPDGLRGDQLTLQQKILIAADAMDAMTSDRPYRRGLPLASAVEELKRCARLPYDPRLVPNDRGPCDQFDPQVVLAMVEGLIANPIPAVVPSAPTREDLQIADYLLREATVHPQRDARPVHPERSRRAENPSAQRQNCWELFSCGRNPGGPKVDELGTCPAATATAASGLNGGLNGGRICWAVAGTRCGGHGPGQTNHGPHRCGSCKFFLKVREEEGLADFRLLTKGSAEGVG